MNFVVEVSFLKLLTHRLTYFVTGTTYNKHPEIVIDTAMLDHTFQTVQTCDLDPGATGSNGSLCSTPLTSTQRSFPLVCELSPSFLLMTEDEQGSSDFCNPQYQ